MSNGGWVSDAEVAEVPFTAFSSRNKHGQDTLFDDDRHHAFITNSPSASSSPTAVTAAMR